MTVKDKLMMYCYRKMNELEQRKRDLDYSKRFRPSDSLDLYEMMREDVYIECSEHIFDEIFTIVLNCK